MLVAFIANIIQNRQLLIGNELRNLLNQLALLDLIGNFRHDQLPCPAGQFFNAGWFPTCVILPAIRETRAHTHRTAARRISSADHRWTIHQHTTGRKIRAPDNLHQLVMAGLRIFNQQHRRVNNFSGIM